MNETRDGELSDLADAACLLWDTRRPVQHLADPIAASDRAVRRRSIVWINRSKKWDLVRVFVFRDVGAGDSGAEIDADGYGGPRTPQGKAQGINVSRSAIARLLHVGV
jgi:hypothetical protein